MYQNSVIKNLHYSDDDSDSDKKQNTNNNPKNTESITRGNWNKMCRCFRNWRCDRKRRRCLRYICNFRLRRYGCCCCCCRWHSRCRRRKTNIPDNLWRLRRLEPAHTCSCNVAYLGSCQVFRQCIFAEFIVEAWWWTRYLFE